MEYHLNVEIKARLRDPGRARAYLLDNNADFRGTDEQTDTYFHSQSGRLKLREGIIETNLIYYHREDLAGARNSVFKLVPVPDPPGLKEILSAAMGIKVIVRKRREIYYIANVKFHIDEVDGLGSFLEIEAGNLLAEKTEEELQAQCAFYIRELDIRDDDSLPGSYSDMLLALNGPTG